MKVNSKMMSLFMLLPLLHLLASVSASAAYIDTANMTVTATSTQSGPWNPQNIVKQDGLIETPVGSGVYSLTATDYAYNTGTIEWRSGYNFPVGGVNDGHPIVTINLDNRAPGTAQDYTIDKIHVWNYNSSGETGLGFATTTIQYSLDGTTWKTVPKVFVFKQATGAPAPGIDAAPGGVGYTGEDYVLPFPIRAHYVRFQADSTWGADRGALGKVRFNNAGGTAPNPPAYTLSVPDDAGFINVKLAPYNATGDGVTDDTAAIQQAINDWQGTGRTIYLPNGTYLVSNTLRFTEANNSFGHNNLRGQSRTGTVIQLKNGTFTSAASAKAVVFTGYHFKAVYNANGQQVFNADGSPAESGVTADWFDNNIADLTISTGCGNPGAVGLQFYSNNIGAVRNVSILSGDGQGVIGLDLSYDNNLSVQKNYLIGENGPLLIKNLKVYGFNIGINTGRNNDTDHLINSQTFEHITLQNQNTVAFQNNSQNVSVRDLVTIGSVPAFKNLQGVSTLIDSTLQGSGAAALVPAITNGEILFVRNVRTPGFASAVQGTNGAGSLAGQTVTEFASSQTGFGSPTQAASLFASAATSLNLNIKETPEVPQDDPNTWANVRNFRQTGDVDDTAAIQAAMNSGATTVYFPKGSPYRISSTVTISGNVRRVVCCFSDFTVATSVAFSVTGGTYPTLTLEDTSELANLSIQNTTTRTLVLKNASISPVAGFTGDLFAENVVGGNWTIGSQKLYARQLNIENDGTHLTNNGGTVWILGYKTERGGTLIDTEAGGKTELLGGLCYTTTDAGTAPMFIINNASASLNIGEFQSNGGFSIYKYVVQETRSGVTRNMVANFLSGDQIAPRRNSPANAWNGSALPLYIGYSGTITQDPIYRYAPDGSRNINRYDGTTGSFVSTFATVATGSNPQFSGVAFGPDGKLYASAPGRNKILRFDGQSGTYLDVFASSVNYASQLVFNTDGNLYTDGGSYFSPSGVATGMYSGGQIAFESGNMFQVSGFWLLQYYSPTYAEDVAYGTWFGGILAANGYIYVADYGPEGVANAGSILRYDATNITLDPGFAITGISGPSGMAIAPNGNLVVSTGAGVTEYNPFTGAFVRNLPGAGGFFVFR